METIKFDYDLPESLIASYPVKQRDHSRLLLVDRQTGALEDKKFYDILSQINENDLIVFNNSRVMAARLYGNKMSGGKLEFLIEKVFDAQSFSCHIKANKAPQIGTKVLVVDAVAEVVFKQDSLYHVRLNEASIWQLMQSYGHMPLPPYMKRKDEAFDAERYQTVYSKLLGSVAAPTAGLHFTKTLINQIKAKGINCVNVTLHVGSGTFKPVKVDNVKEHVMHSELIDVSQEVCQRIKETKVKNGRVIAVGTTSVRSLETAALNGEIAPFYGESDIFLYPGEKFNVVDAMITNFHLPKSTLIMLVSAFSSIEIVKKAYQHAIDEQYRFYSYGDAMFIY